jgi:uncharacterized protein (DUF1330 family)
MPGYFMGMVHAINDGDWAPMGVIVVEFESGEASRKWYNSPEYQAVIGQRLSSTDSNTVFMDSD